MTSESTVLNEKFRLWITTESSPKFPISLLQIAIKYTAEPPQGIRAGLKRTFQGLQPEIVDISNLPQWKRIYFLNKIKFYRFYIFNF